MNDPIESTSRDRVFKCNSRLYVKVFGTKTETATISRCRSSERVPSPYNVLLDRARVSVIRLRAAAERASRTCLLAAGAGVTEEKPTGAKSQSGPVTPSLISADRSPSRRPRQVER